MVRQPRKRWTEARALLQRGRGQRLIARAPNDEDAPWEFPGGRVERGESPEAALRRFCRDQLGIEIEIHLGQPPFEYQFGSHSVVYRYYMCGVRDDDAVAPPTAETRWVLTAQLREYMFDTPTQQVVDWLLEEDPKI